MKDLNLKEISKKFESKLSKIKVALFDVDGILTDGKVFFQGEEVGFNRFFHVRDGYGIRMLRRAGLKVGIISGGNSEGLRKRLDGLGVDFHYLGREDKRSAYLEIKEKLNLNDESLLYMGDEFFDMPLLKKAGFSATVPEASIEVQKVCDYVTITSCGNGAVREVIDMLRYVQNIVPEVPDFD